MATMYPGLPFEGRFMSPEQVAENSPRALMAKVAAARSDVDPALQNEQKQAVLERIREATKQIKIQTAAMEEAAYQQKQAGKAASEDARTKGWEAADARHQAAVAGLRGKTHKMPAGTKEVIPGTGIYATDQGYSNIGVESREGLTEGERRGAEAKVAEETRKTAGEAIKEYVKGAGALFDPAKMVQIPAAVAAGFGGVTAGAGVAVGSGSEAPKGGVKAKAKAPEKVAAGGDFTTKLNVLKLARSPELVRLAAQQLVQEYPDKATEISAIAMAKLAPRGASTAPIGAVPTRGAAGQSPVANLMGTLTGTGVTGPYGPNADILSEDIPWYLRQGR